MSLSSAPWSHVVAAIVLGAVAVTMACAPEGSSSFDRIDRHAFNRTAVRLNLPVFWVADVDGNGVPQPTEVASLLFYPTTGPWVEDGRFTRKFEAAYEQIVTAAESDAPDVTGVDEVEAERRRLVRQDLDFGIATLVASDLRNLPDDHRAFVRRMLRAAELIDQIYARQTGCEALAGRLPAGDTASASLFRRNWGPRGVAPATERDPACSAIPGAPGRVVDPYPAELQESGGFCADLEQHPRASELLSPFSVVREHAGELVAIPVSEAYADLLEPLADELRAAASELTDPSEEHLRTYLRAAAESCLDNNWEPADEAWAAMGSRNSQWYLRVGPDEVYWEPCSQKAGFHLTLARINRGSLEWQDRLTEVRQEMENEMAGRVGAPYAPREVSFQLPDFIDIVINAGDDRDPLGATIGQSLPNWGPVANEGRGRTVAMSNLYTDPDSLQIRRAQAASLFDSTTMEFFTDDALPGLLGSVLHEAAHNLGPSHEYAVDGKVDTEIFGGPLASTLEELKAQSAALWYVEFLRRRGLVSDDLARQCYVDGLVWAFGHISRGMYTADGGRKAYSQLAAAQVGFLLEHGALRFEPDAIAANGTDRGVFVFDFDLLPAGIDEMMRIVGEVKARGDRDRGESLVDDYVDGDAVPQDVIRERMLRHPKASFVYAVDL